MKKEECAYGGEMLCPECDPDCRKMASTSKRKGVQKMKKKSGKKGGCKK